MPVRGKLDKEVRQNFRNTMFGVDDWKSLWLWSGSFVGIQFHICTDISATVREKIMQNY